VWRSGYFLADWLVQSAPTRRATTSVSYERCVRDHVLPYLGDVLLCSLTPEDVRRWQSALLCKPRRFREAATYRAPLRNRWIHPTGATQSHWAIWRADALGHRGHVGGRVEVEGSGRWTPEKPRSKT
jgi:hypothetical protein